jgi:hypothetical protein
MSHILDIKLSSFEKTTTANHTYKPTDALVQDFTRFSDLHAAGGYLNQACYSSRLRKHFLLWKKDCHVIKIQCQSLFVKKYGSEFVLWTLQLWFQLS